MLLALLLACLLAAATRRISHFWPPSCIFMPCFVPNLATLPQTLQEDVMGGWEAEMFEDLMPQYDDEADETEYEDFDSPAADY